MNYKDKVIKLLMSKELTEEQKDKLLDIFPELKESDDEKIRQELIETIHLAYDCGCSLNKEQCDKYLAWLEKQGEKEKFIKKELGCIQGYREEAIRRLHELEKQEWSEEDKKMLAIIISDYVDRLDSTPPEELAYSYSKSIDWLRSLKDRVLLKPQPELSEEDRDLIEEIISHYKHLIAIGSLDSEHYKSYIIPKLKSLRPQNTWKPSKEQMEAVRIAAEIGTVNNSWAMGILKGMYQDLKKL